MISRRSAFIVVLVALAGTGTSLAVAALAGMDPTDLSRLAVMLLLTVPATTIVAVGMSSMLTRSSMRRRLLAVPVIAAFGGVVNIGVLGKFMFMSTTDAVLVAILLAHSAAAGVAMVLGVVRTSTTALSNLQETANLIAGGKFSVRAGDLRSGPEIDSLARSLDDVASRLSDSMEREKRSRARRSNLGTALRQDLSAPSADLLEVADTLSSGGDLSTPDLKNLGGRIRRAITPLEELADDLQDLMHLEADITQADPQDVSIEDLVRGAVQENELEAMENRVLLEARLDEMAQVTTSRRLARPLSRLLRSIIRRSPGTVIRIQITTGRWGMDLAIHASGRTIDEQRAYAGVPADDAAAPADQNGAGFAIPRRAIEALGGQVRAHSVSPEHTKVVVGIPRQT